MGKALDGIASSIGSAFGNYKRALTLAWMGRKPSFFTGVADEAGYLGKTGYEEAAQKRAIVCSHVFSAVSLISRAVSAAEFQVVEYKGVDSKPVQIPNHDIESLLRVPNPYMGGVFLWEYTTWWLQLDGNAYWWLGTDELGRLREIWPLPSADIEIIPGDKDKLIAGYEYTVHGGIYPIPAENIIHLALPNPYDIFRGMSRLRAGMLAIDTDLAMSRWNARFFGKDNTMPSAVINLSTGDANHPIDRADLDALRDDLASGYSALQRKTAVTGAYSMDVELLGWNPKDLDFIQGREATGTEIYKLFGIPGGLFDKDATYANSENANRVFNNKTLWPLLRLIAEQITGQMIVPLYGKDFAAGFEDVRTTNREQELSEINAAGPYLTIDEVRERWYGVKALPKGRGVKTSQEQTSVSTESAWDDSAGTIEGEYTEEDPKEEKPKGKKPKRLTAETDREAVDDMRRWKRKALNALSRDRPLPLAFTTKTIPQWAVDQLRQDLTRLRVVQKAGVVSREVLIASVKQTFTNFIESLQEVGGTAVTERPPHPTKAITELRNWEAVAVQKMAQTERPLLLYRTTVVPVPVVQFVRQELELSPRTEAAVRSVFREALDFYYPFRRGG